MRGALLAVCLALPLSGCSLSPSAEFIKALAEDQSTACVRISNPMYGEFRWYRSNTQGGQATCNADGMSVVGGTLPNAPAGSTVVAPPGASVITAPKPAP